jgi:tRNA (mo5U34)-methyltransferase
VTPIAPQLAAELRREPRWMYPWRLAPGERAPLLADELESVHATRRDLIEGPVRERLAAVGPGATAVDLACNEGWFSQCMLDWGAARVVGIDVRELHVRRARLVREHFGIEPERLALEEGDVFALDTARLGTFDVVLNLGLVYHVEDPVGAIRRARELTAPGGLCVVESQLTRQAEPILHGWGRPDHLESAPASFAARLEHDQESNTLASAGGVVSLIPNRAALELAMAAAGFEDVRFLEARPGQDPQYVEGDRAIAVGRAPA